MRRKLINKIACVIAACVLIIVLGIAILALTASLYCLVGPHRASLWGINTNPWQLIPITLVLVGAGGELAKMLGLKLKTSPMQYVRLFAFSIPVLLGGVLLADDQVYRQLHPFSRHPWLANLGTLLYTLLYLISYYHFLLIFRLEIIRAFRRLFRMDFIPCMDEMIPTVSISAESGFQEARDLLVEYRNGDATLSFKKADLNFFTGLHTWMREEKHLSPVYIQMCFMCYRNVFRYAKELHHLRTPFPFRDDKLFFINEKPF